MKIRKFLTILLAISLMVFVFTGCGAQSVAMGENKGYDDMAAETVGAESGSGLTSTTQGGQPAPTTQKLIRTVDLEAETAALDTFLSDVEGRVTQLGGYVENRNVYNGKSSAGERRWANLTIRIPADKLDQFVTQVSDASNVISHRETTKDVTLTYVATESRIKALEVEEARLLELLAAAESMEDILLLESKLADVRTELEQYTSQLRVMENQVSYATVNLSVSEVVEFTQVEEPEPEPTFWQKLGRGFVSGLKNTWEILKALVILFVSAIPYLIVPGIIVAAILIPRAIRRKKEKKEKTE